LPIYSIADCQFVPLPIDDCQLPIARAPRFRATLLMFNRQSAIANRQC
jgi:hypothetical protein